MPTSTVINHNTSSHNTFTMLTRFMTSQHDHDGCLCVGINILPNLTGQLTSPSPLPSSRGADSCESGQRDYSSLPSFPPPPCCLPTGSSTSLHSLLTRWSTHRNRAQLSQHYNPCQNLTPRRSAFKTYSGLVSQCSLHVDRTALTCRAGVGWRVGGGGGQVGQNWGWLQCPILI